MNRRTLVLILTAALAALSSNILAVAAPISTDLTSINDPATWRIHNRNASLMNDAGRNVVQLDAGTGDGIAWLVGSSFSTGTIEVDLRGRNNPGRSFVGIAFAGVDDATFEAIYFRPFNFEQQDAVRRARSVQYVSMPEYDWSVLREKHPGKFESGIDPIPKAEAWLHARIVIHADEVRVFVNDSPEPCLVVERLTDRTGGGIGLWVGNGSDGAFASLTINLDSINR